MLAGKVFCFSDSQHSLKWIIDSGATDHIAPHLNFFSSYVPITQTSFTIMPIGKHARISHIGPIKLSPSLTLYNVLHVLKFNAIYFLLTNMLSS